MGGSSRSDVQSLAILNPTMVLCCGMALLTFRQEHWREKKFSLMGFALLFLLVAFYLMPFTAVLGAMSQGGGSLADLRDNTNASNSSMTLSIMPTETWMSLASLFAPLAVFLFAMQLTRDELTLTLPLVIFIGAISGVIGVLQLAGGSEGPLYLYRITNNGSAVGLFANRNHAAVFLACLFPVLAVFAKSSRRSRNGGRNMQQLIAMSVAILLVPLILVTGSRAGMLAGIMAMIGGAVLYSSQISANDPQRKDRSRTLVLVAAVLLCLVFTTIYFARAEAIDRLFVDAGAANSRAEFWASSLKLYWKYYPFGFGPGSFVAAFESEEPVKLLNQTYVNRAHNDWLETGLTFGVPGILLMLGGVVCYARRSFLLWFCMDGRRSAVVLGRMASIIIAILGIASISDYPLRTPAMMGLGAIVLLWFVEARRETKVNAANLS
jgi:O-antigen ligase